MTNQDSFDHLALDWGFTTHVDSDEIQHIIDVSGITEGSDVLDVGTGVMIPFILEAMRGKGHITGVDLSEEMPCRARKKNS